MNNKVTAVLFVVALALAPMVQAAIEPQGGPSVSNRNAPKTRSRPAQMARPYRIANAGANERAAAATASSLPVVTVHSTDNVTRGKTGTFVLKMTSNRMLSSGAVGGTYVFFSLSGTAINGVDYKLLAGPAYISQSGLGVIQIETLPDLRGSASNQSYSVTVTLEAGAGYALGSDASRSATMWIKPAEGIIPPNS